MTIPVSLNGSQKPSGLTSDFEQSEEVGKLFAAIAQAQIKIVGVVKDSENPFFSSKFASLQGVWEECHAAFNEQGLALVQMPYSKGNDLISLVTVIGHSSGQWMRSTLTMAPVSIENTYEYKNGRKVKTGEEKKVNDTPQGAGSCISYMRRYALAAATGVAQMDDDGNSASGRKVPEPAGGDGVRKVPEKPAPKDKSLGDQYRDAVAEWQKINGSDTTDSKAGRQVLVENCGLEGRRKATGEELTQGLAIVKSYIENKVTWAQFAGEDE